VSHSWTAKRGSEEGDEFGQVDKCHMIGWLTLQLLDFRFFSTPDREHLRVSQASKAACTSITHRLDVVDGFAVD
jgi:hypothetical protein